jgi:hypothetical protein
MFLIITIFHVFSMQRNITKLIINLIHITKMRKFTENRIKLELSLIFYTLQLGSIKDFNNDYKAVQSFSRYYL